MMFEKEELKNKIQDFYLKVDPDAHLETPWCRLFGAAGSDKGFRDNRKIRNPKWHNYSRLYHHLLSDKTDLSLNIFEMGLGTTNPSIPSSMGKNGVPGASHRVWSNIFLKSRIYGGDIDKDIIFQSPIERIFTSYCDQTDPQSVKNVFKDNNVFYDLIIDDGLHEPHANICMFENSYEFLNKGGLYIIEDLNCYEFRDEHEENLNKIKKTYKPQYAQILELNSEVNKIDNVVMVILK